MRKKLVINAISLGILTLFAVYISISFADIRALDIEHFAYLPCAAGSVIVTTTCTALLSRRLTVPLGVNLGVLESISLSTAASAGNNLGPLRFGAAMRAAYLKRVHGLSIGHFVSSLFGMYVTTSLIAALMGLVGLAALKLQGANNLGVMCIINFVCVVGSVFLACCPRIPKTENLVVQKLNYVIDGWRKIRREPSTTAAVLLLTLVQQLSMATTFWLAFAALGMEQSVGAILLLTSIGILASYFGITPGGLGVFELTVAFVANQLGIEPHVGVAVALIVRAINVSTIFALLPFASMHLADRMKQVDGHQLGESKT